VECLAARLVTGPPGHLVSFAIDLGSLLLGVLLTAIRRRLRRPKGRRV
jgi:hypothetical protein